MTVSCTNSSICENNKSKYWRYQVIHEKIFRNKWCLYRCNLQGRFVQFHKPTFQFLLICTKHKKLQKEDGTLIQENLFKIAVDSLICFIRHHYVSWTMRSRATWNAAIRDESWIFSLVPEASLCLKVKQKNQITVFYFVLFSRSDHKLPFTIHLRVKFHKGKRIHDLGEDFAKAWQGIWAPV